jgi:hypothetical protein
MVQPKVPWPVFAYRFPYRVAPTTGVQSGVIGRSPVQKLAWLTSPPCGNRSVTECSRVARRGARRRWLKVVAGTQAGEQSVADRAGSTGRRRRRDRTSHCKRASKEKLHGKHLKGRPKMT